MVAFHALFALTMRHLRLLKRDVNLIMSTLYWPLLDVLIWGFLGSYMQQSQVGAHHNYVIVSLLGIVLWRTTSSAAIVTARGFVEELWSNNLINLISLPLRLTEWIGGIMVYSAVMSCFTAFYCMVLIMLIYGINPALLIGHVIMFVPPLFLCGLAIGMFCLTIIAYCGKRAEELYYVFAWFFAPFSTAFYPREILPHWAQMISDCLPMSYIFTGMRASLMQNADPIPFLLQGYGMAISYLLVAIFCFGWAFKSSKKRGLARLAD